MSSKPTLTQRAFLWYSQLPSSSVPNGTLGIQGGQQSQSAPVQNSNDELEPKPVDLAPTDMLLGSFPRALNQIPDGLASRIMQQWPLHSSHADLGDLELTRLRDLQIPKIHRGKYCMYIRFPFRIIQ